MYVQAKYYNESNISLDHLESKIEGGACSETSVKMKIIMHNYDMLSETTKWTEKNGFL